MGNDVTYCSKLTSEIVTSRAGLATLSFEWNELLSSSQANTIFLTWEWVSAWLEAVFPDAPLFVVAVRDAKGRLIAIAPFYRSDLHLLGLVKYKCLRIIGDGQSGAEYGDVIIRCGFEDVAMTFVMRELIKHDDVWDCIYIPNMAGWTGAQERFSRVCEQLGLYMHELIRKFSTVKLPDTHEAYLKLLSRDGRKQIRRRTRRLKELHDVELVYCDCQSKLPQLLSSLFVLHRRRWESVGQAGGFVRRPPMKRFYESFAPEALRKGWLRLYALKVDGVVKAVQYGYAYGGVLSALQDGCDLSFSGIGNVLRNLVIKACIEDGLCECDFLGGFTDHKHRLGAEPREGYDLFIGRMTLKNRLLFWKNVWPTGRFIQEGRPANEGHSHD